MKIVVINGSPRAGGNCDALCDMFLKGAKEAGCETEKVNLTNLRLSPCSACYACRKTGKCIYKDGMDELLERLIQSDVILLATPVYFYSMGAQMKMFIDRCLPRYQEMKDKDFYFAVTAADPNHDAMEPTIAGFRGYIACLSGAKEKGVFYGTGAWEKWDILGLPVMEKVYEAGKNLKNT